MITENKEKIKKENQNKSSGVTALSGVVPLMLETLGGFGCCCC